MENGGDLYDTMFSILLMLKRDLLAAHPRIGESELSHVHIGILSALRAHSRLPASELGKKLYVSKPQMTLLLDKLEGLGFIARVADEEDRRVTSIELTEGGALFLKESLDRCRTEVEDRLSALDETDRAELAASLAKVSSLFEKIASSERR